MCRERLISVIHDNNNNNIISTNVEHAADILLQSNYGIHALVIYSDLVTLREFLSIYTNKGLEEKNELVCLAPFYDTVEFVRKILSQGRMEINLQKYENDERSLIIIDSSEKDFDRNGIAFDKESVLNFNKHLIECANKLNKKGTSILGDVGAFLFKDLLQGLVDYELYLLSQFDLNLKVICLYHHGDFDRLSEDSKRKIIKNHKIAIKI